MTDFATGQDYGVHVQQASADALVDAARQRVEAQTAAPPDDNIAVKPIPEYPGVFGVYLKDSLVGFSQDLADAESIAARYRGETPKTVGSGGTGQPESMTAGLGEAKTKTAPPGLEVPGIVERIGRDIGSGLVQLPTMVATGVLKGSAEMFRAGDSLATWLEQNLGTLGIGDVGPEGTRNPGQRIAAWLEQSQSGGLPKPRSVTSGVVQSIAQFAVGAKAFGGGTAGTVAAGGVAFDPYEGNLANLIERVPSLKNPITDALSVGPEDSEGMARAKNAIATELTVLGVKGAQKLAEGVWRGVQFIRASRSAGREPTKAMSMVEQQKAQYGTVADEQIALGDPKAPLVSTEPTGFRTARIAKKLEKGATETGVPTDIAAKGLVKSGEAGGKEVYVNFARINTPEDVKKTIGQMADAFAPEVKEATRGVRTNEATKAAADSLGLKVGDVLSRRQGQLFNAEEALAARQLWAASAEKLTELAKKAADPNAGAVDLYNFRRMMSVHAALQAEVIGARTETARALQSWAIPAGGGIEKARAIQMLLDQSGGQEMSRGLAQRLATLADMKASPDAIAAFARKGWGATSWDIVQESFVNGLLWNPATHAANTSSNIITAFQQIYERAVAGKISKALRRVPGEGVAGGEELAQTYGMMQSLRDALRAASKSLTTGESGAIPGKIDLPHEPALTARRIAVEIGKDPAAAEAFRQTGLGKAVDYLGFATRVPGRLLGAEDSFFKAVGYRMEVYAQSLRQATAEGLSGPALYERMAQLANNPSEGIRIAAVDAALYQTFTNAPGKWAEAAMKVRQNVPPSVLAMPFVRTPANLFRYSFERSPLAPFVAQWRADVAAGGARADIALARAATGSAILAVFADTAYDGAATGAGPSNQGEREALQRQGWQPYSVYIDGKWYQYNRGTSIGMMLSAVATMAELVRASDFSPEDYDELTEIIGGAGYAVTQSIVDQSFMQGAADLAAVAKDPKQFAPSYINNLLGAMVPLGSAQNTINRAIDPTAKEVMGPWSAIQQRLLGMKERLTPRRDLWGKAVEPQAVYGRTFDLTSPAKVSEPIDSPIDAEMTRLGVGVLRIAKKTSFAGVAINFRDYPEAYDEYVRLAGNELKSPGHNNMGAKDFLDSVVSGKSAYSELYQKLYSDGPEGMKAQYIKQTIHQYRQMAAQKILADPKFTVLAQLVKQKQAEAQQQKMPPGMQLPAMQ
jgi:hypothetical protein